MPLKALNKVFLQSLQLANFYWHILFKHCIDEHQAPLKLRLANSLIKRSSMSQNFWLNQRNKVLIANCFCHWLPEVIYKYMKADEINKSENLSKLEIVQIMH